MNTTPAYIIEEKKLKNNLQKFKYIQDHTQCKILLALKAFACPPTFALLKTVLNGCTASGLHEAKLGKEEFQKEVHTFSPAFTKEEFKEIATYSDHISFNSINQWRTFKNDLLEKNDIGLRLNPEHNEVENPLYSPCAPGSRFGILSHELENLNLDGISGFLIHALCQKNEDSLERLIQAIENKFASYLIKPQIKWVNLGGGHMVTRDNYNLKKCCDVINQFQNKYNIQVILEPGESIALNTGILKSKVVDIIHNSIDIAILDTSATAHMPDVLEMPYTPDIVGAKKPNELPYTYRLGGNTCLTGDIIGEYSFESPLKIGDILTFTDMAHYTMVKNTTFNGIPLPTIIILDEEGQVKHQKTFNYTAFRDRLG